MIIHQKPKAKNVSEKWLETGESMIVRCAAISVQILQNDILCKMNECKHFKFTNWPDISV